MKFCVYAICKNESKFVEKWLKSMSEADYICVLDTGSNDGTYEALQNAAKSDDYQGKIIVAQQIIKPWRFDVARNESMKLIPEDADFCICTDLDEVLIQGWRNEFERVISNFGGLDHIDRIFYKYAWSHTEDGGNGHVFWYDKAHKNNGKYYWKHPVHEILTYDGDDEELVYGYTSDDMVLLHHYPDKSKSRASYLGLLEQRAEESDDDFYGLVYLAHEYFYQGLPQKCISFIEGVVLPKISENKDDMLCRTDLYMFLGDANAALGNIDAAKNWHIKGIEYTPTYRENYLCLATLLYQEGKYRESIEVVNRCLVNTTRYFSWLERGPSWSYQPYDLLSICYWELGKKDVALVFAKVAMELNPMEERLVNNYNFMLNKV